MIVKRHSKPLVRLGVAPGNLVDGPLRLVLVALWLLCQLGHVGIVADHCRLAKVKYFGQRVVGRRANRVLSWIPGGVVDLRRVMQDGLRQ